MLQLEDVIEDDAGKVIGRDGGFINAALNIVHDRGPFGGAATVPGVKERNQSLSLNYRIAYEILRHDIGRLFRQQPHTP